MTLPIFYSFRRCPYAMRARLALQSTGIQVELREIVLKDKAPEFLDTSPSKTVPCLKAGKRIIDESLHIMAWALGQKDPEHWLEMPPEGYELIAQCDGPFKQALDRTKYATRYPENDPSEERKKASDFIEVLETQLTDGFLFADTPKVADMAILPFVRQFANTDKTWFANQPWPKVQTWLDTFVNSDQFSSIMNKYPKWTSGDPITLFPK